MTSSSRNASPPFINVISSRIVLALGLLTSCQLQASEALIVDDPATMQTYEDIGYTPFGTGNNLSFTSARTINALYNTYQVGDNGFDLKTSMYLDNQAILDSRAEESNAFSVPNGYGYGYDFGKMISLFDSSQNKYFDEIIYRGFALCGDEQLTIKPDYYSSPSSKSAQAAGTFESMCMFAELPEGSVSSFDFVTDLVLKTNTGQNDAMNHISIGNWHDYFQQGVSAGLLKGFSEFYEQFGDRTSLGFAVGGPGRSSFFSDVVASSTLRTNFTNSVIDIFERFPMFKSVHILWPLTRDCDSTCSTDWQNYHQLLSELRTALDTRFQGDSKGITILIQNTDLFDDEYAEAVKQLVELDIRFRVDLNTKFTEKSEQATPLLAHDISASQIETIANFLNKHKLPKDRFNFDLGNGSTAVGGADLAEWTYDPALDSLGTFVDGTVDNFDLYNNYLTISENTPTTGQNGFKLYTVTNDKASFVHSGIADQYISHTSPLIAKQAGALVRHFALGGVSFDGGGLDNPIVYNALKEGAGQSLEQTDTSAFDMSQTYNCGTIVVNQEGSNEHILLSDSESDSVCKGVFSNDFSGYRDVSAVKGSNFGPAKVGDYLQLKVKQGDETLAVAQHLVTSSGQVSGDHRKANYSSQQLNSVLNDIDHFTRFKVGERKTDGQINTISSTHRNKLYCGYDCEGISIEQKVLSSTYSQVSQLKGYDVKPHSLITLNVYKDGELYASTNYQPSAHMSVGFRWPDELCKIANADNDPQDILECGELVGFDEFKIINSSVYRNYIWSSVNGITTEINVASPASNE